MGQKRNEEGFTLIELLIVIIILAILAAIVVFAVGTTSANALSATCGSDAKTFETALVSYDAQMGSYPPAGPGATASFAPQLTQTFTVNGETVGPFLRQLPSTAHYEIVTDGIGGVFVVPSGTPPASLQASILDSQFPAVNSIQALFGISGDNNHPNFDSDPGICSDNNVVS